MNEKLLYFTEYEIFKIKKEVYNSYYISCCLIVTLNSSRNLIRVSHIDAIEKIFIEFCIKKTVDEYCIFVSRYLCDDKDMKGGGREFRTNRASIHNILRGWIGYITQEYVYKKYPSFQKTYFIIKKLSNRFWQIYINGLLLEKRCSYEAGMLYRKALEFLFIDYIKDKGYKYDKKITIGNICKDENIKKYFNKAEDILEFIKGINTYGNDYSHYRDEEELDLSNIIKMRKKMQLFISYIVAQKEAKETEDAIKNSLQNKSYP